MKLDRQAEAVLLQMARAAEGEPDPRDFAGKLAKARRDAAALQAFSKPAPEGIARQDVTVPESARAGFVPVRLYRPRDVPRPHLLVWFHGGGTIAGSLDVHEPVLMALAERTGRAVASIGYMLAPEAVFPAQHEECLGAARWLVRERPSLGLEIDGWAIGGDSIGGLYATATAISLRDDGFSPAPSAQVLVYPNTDLRENRDFASLRQNEGRIMTRASLAFEATTAVPIEADRAGPRASPLMAANLAKLPPALVVTGEADPLRDEGQAYADRLAQAGVAVSRHPYAGMIHAFLQMNGTIDAADSLMDEIAAFLDGAD